MILTIQIDTEKAGDISNAYNILDNLNNEDSSLTHNTLVQEPENQMAAAEKMMETAQMFSREQGQYESRQAYPSSNPAPQPQPTRPYPQPQPQQPQRPPTMEEQLRGEDDF